MTAQPEEQLTTLTELDALYSVLNNPDLISDETYDLLAPLVEQVRERQLAIQEALQTAVEQRDKKTRQVVILKKDVETLNQNLELLEEAVRDRQKALDMADYELIDLTESIRNWHSPDNVLITDLLDEVDAHNGAIMIGQLEKMTGDYDLAERLTEALLSESGLEDRLDDVIALAQAAARKMTGGLEDDTL